MFASEKKLSVVAPGSSRAQYYPLISVKSQSGDTVGVGSDIIYDLSSSVKLVSQT
jgi:hypothetical protein